MKDIQSNLNAFVALAENSGSWLTCEAKERSFGMQSWLGRFWTWLTNGYERLDVCIGEAFYKVFKDIEVLGGSREALDKAGVDVEKVELAANAVMQRLDRWSGKAAQCEKKRIYRHILSLKYRLGLKSEEAEDITKLQKLAHDFKQNFIFDEKVLTDTDLAKLKKAATYPGFVEALLNDVKMRQRFFKWTIRDNAEVEPFALFPACQERLSKSFLEKRDGKLDNDLLKVQKIEVDGILKKTVTLKIEGERRDILDKKRVYKFGPHMERSVRDIIQVFKDKRELEVGDMEVDERGVIFWNPKHLKRFNFESGEWEQIDLDAENLVEQLPRLHLTLEKVRKWYGDEIEAGKAYMVARASRQHEGPDPIDAHGWPEILIPVDGENRFRWIPYGKYVLDYPVTVLQKMQFAAGTLPGRVYVPDEGIYYRHRKHAHKVFEADQSAAVERLRLRMKQSISGNLKFQFQGDNCANMAKEDIGAVIGDEKVHSLYRMPLWDIKPTGFQGMLMKIFKTIPWPSVRDWAYDGLMACFGATKPMVVTVDGEAKRETLLANEFFKEKVLQCPLTLFDHSAS